MAERKYRIYLREWREARDLTQEQVAVAVRSNKGDVSKMERGLKRLHEDLLQRFADVFDILPFQLYFPPEQVSLDALAAGASAELRRRIVRLVQAVLEDEGRK